MTHQLRNIGATELDFISNVFIFYYVFHVVAKRSKCVERKQQNRPPSGGKVKVKLHKHLLDDIECECTDGLSDAVLKTTITPLEKGVRRWSWRQRGQSV